MCLCMYFSYFNRVLSRVLFGNAITAAYIGVTDRETEGKWFGVNGNRYASTDFPWVIHDNESLEPIGRENENCAIMSFAQMQKNDLRVWDVPCSRNDRGLCEKVV